MKAMKTSEVRVDVKLNKHIWSKGVRNVRGCRHAATLASEAGRRAGRCAHAAARLLCRSRAACASRSPAAATTTRTPRRVASHALRAARRPRVGAHAHAQRWITASALAHAAPGARRRHSLPRWRWRARTLLASRAGAAAAAQSAARDTPRC